MLNSLEDGWQTAYNEALRVSEDGQSADTIFDQLYFDTITRKAITSGDTFLQQYTRTVIDLYNLKAQLRILVHPQVASGVKHISGGSFGVGKIETKEQILAIYQTMGGQTVWRSAVESYLESQNTTELDARADDYVLSMTREAAYDMFSSASLVLYYLRSKQSAANIRTLITLRDAGVTEDKITPNLRTAYVKE
jgi:vacuolar-type H+-ATPase subunit C/Vma6